MKTTVHATRALTAGSSAIVLAGLLAWVAAGPASPAGARARPDADRAVEKIEVLPPPPRAALPAPEGSLPDGGLPVSSRGGWMLVDPTRPRLYVSEDTLNALTVVDLEKPRVEKRLFVGSQPAGLAMSPDGTTLYVAVSGGSDVVAIDLKRLEARKTLRFGFTPYSLACPEANKLYISSIGQGPRILDLRKNECVGISGAPWIRGGDLVQAQPGSGQVFFGATKVSPASVCFLDRSATPRLVRLHEHGALGSNLGDMRFSGDGSRLYVCCGAPYYVQVLDPKTLRLLARLDTGPYPRRVAPAPDGSRVYATHAGNHVDVFDAVTFLPVGCIPASGEPTGLAVSRDGRKLVILTANGLWLRDTSQVEPPRKP